MTFSTRNFTPWPHYPQIPKFCYTNIAFSLETHCCRRHTKFLHHLGTPKTTIRTKIGGGWARGASKNWRPLRISATVESRNFKLNFGTQIEFETSLPKNNVLAVDWLLILSVTHWAVLPKSGVSRQTDFSATNVAL